VYGPFFSEKATATGTAYLDMLEKWLWPQLKKDFPGQPHFQQNRAPSHFHMAVRNFLDENLLRLGWDEQDPFLGLLDPKSVLHATSTYEDV
jgi:hypothetical protein